MNKNEHLSEKCKARYEVNKIIMEQKAKEIKNTLKNELFLSKNKTSHKNKYNYLFQKQIFQKEASKSKEKNEKTNNLNLKFSLYKDKDKNKDNLNNINSISMSNQKYKFTPKNATIGNTFNTNSNLFFNVKDKISKKLINKNTEDLLPNISALKKLKSTDKLYPDKNEKIDKNDNNDSIPSKRLFSSTTNNFYKNRKLDRNNNNLEDKIYNINTTNNNINNKSINNINLANSTTNKKINSFYRKYTYIIRPENCGYLVKKCFKHRINWIELPDMNQNDFNFKWQQNARNLNFGTLSKIGHFKQMVNHFEYHNVITNKANLFINLIKHSEWEEENVFKYIPFTVLIEYGSDNYFMMMENFEYLFNNIEKFIVPFNEMDLNKYKYYKGRLYSDLFQYGDHVGNKTAINFPDTLFSDSPIQENVNNNENAKNSTDKKIIKNLWLVKAPDLNRGMCIQVVDNINSIKKHINNYYRGIQKGYNREEGKERLISPGSSSLRNKNTNLYNLDKIDNNYNNIRYTNILSQKKDIFDFKNKKQPYNKYRSNIIVLQKYIENPLLYHGRKFDIRIWVLLTHDLKVYMFNEGHLKCCSVKYNLNVSDNFSHLTNYSFQKYNNNFGKYEKGNEVSFDDLQYNINVNYDNSVDFKKDIIPKIKKIIKFVFQSVKSKINGLNRNYTFEIYGFDFMLDYKFNPFLIEVNLNPGLEESSPLIKMLVPRMLDDALRLTLDKEFNTVYNFNGVEKHFNDNDFKYESPFPVIGYSNSENMFKFICDLNLEEGTNKRIMKYRHLRINTNNIKPLHQFF